MTTDLGPPDAESVIVAKPQPGGPIDPPERKATFADITTDRPRRPIVPAWMRSPDQRRQASRWALGYSTHTAVYHVTRTPKYLVKTAWYAPIGAVRGTARAVWWARAEEGNWHLRQSAATRDDPETWLKLDLRRLQSATARWRVLAASAVALAVTVGAVRMAPAWTQWAAALVAVLVLARLGRPVGKPIVDRVYQGAQYRKLTADLVRRAIVATGEVKDPALITFPHEIHRDGPGYLATVDLPDNVIAADIINKRDYLAGGMRLPKTQVWPSQAPGQHPGRMHIWVADQPVEAMRPPAWPLLLDGTVDYFKPFPMGHDPRMRLVNWLLAERNSLAAGIPGSGKSLFVRNIVLGAILDLLVIPVLFELKGTGDYDPIAPLCPPGLYGSGADEGTKKAAMNALLWLERQCDERGERVKHWVRQGLSTENKVNRAMAERDPKLRPILAVFDEIQELFTDKEMGKAAVKTATSITKRGRALGIHVIWATQRIDKEAIPRGISSNVANRACLAVTSHTETDMALPTGSYARGARPTEFEPASGEDPKDSGWSWVCGLGPMQPIRSLYLDNKAAAAVVDRALAMRAGHQQPDPVRTNARNIRVDLRRVWPGGEDRVWSETLVPLLQALDAQAYGDLDVERLNAAMRAAGIEPKPFHRKIEGKGVTRYGVRRDAIADSGARPIESGETP